MIKAYWDLIQQTDDWFAIKHGKIGGTLAGGLFVNSDTLLYKILGENAEDFEVPDNDRYINAAMMRGNELEPHALQYLRQHTNNDYKPCGWLQSAEIDILGISPDGITTDFKHAAEIKCPGAAKHTEYIYKDRLPLEHTHQSIHYFTVNPHLESLTFISYRPENNKRPTLIIRLTRESLVNIGTDARPKIVTVQDAAETARKASLEIQNKVLEILGDWSF